MNWIVMLNEFGSPFFGLFTTFAFTWADIEDGVCLHYNRWDIVPDFSAVDAIEVPVIPTTIESSAATVFVNSPLIPSMDSRYIFFTNGSLISLGTPDVSMGWSWMQIVPDAAFPTLLLLMHMALFGIIPLIYAVLTITPRDSEVTIYTDSQTAIDGL
ncbi:hypothetical protein RhiirA5_441330 [Rhizophagus irregularis]|uniref:Uncharacterized protein n=1 Tax=Rhizophagus irregularis TaxID=588596 RepID=A0A2I1ETC0_9GLOM|nr:hypothetical protein RhiirA5_441330 [Rhizophagus irregularis]PKY25325.1 hypothetical protein RhiirB3_440219 [Rhizophagus irregularis]